MAYLESTQCCGVAELVSLENGHGYNSIHSYEEMIDVCREQHYGQVVAHFIVNGKKHDGQDLFNDLMKHGFRKSRVWVNPNTGNKLRTVWKILTAKERGKIYKEGEYDNDW